MVIHQRPTRLAQLAGVAWGELFADRCTTQADDAIQHGWSPDDPEHYCSRCGETVGPYTTGPHGCPTCAGLSLPWDEVVRIGPYREPLRDWIIAMKFSHAWSWGRWFGDRLADTIGCDEPHERVVICPVPMHWARRLRRGYNQSQVIASRIGEHLDYPVVPLLQRIRYTRPQTQTPHTERRRNQQRSVRVLPVDLAGWSVWLVDDVKTTGSTLKRCARLLRGAGAEHIGVAVVAVADGRQK